MPEEKQQRSGGDLFIVDNSVSGWDGLRYLKDWSSLAKSMDIATGYFEIGSLLALDGQWQQLDKIRILMGDETTRRTRNALIEAKTNRLDTSIEDDKDKNPFLTGVPAIVEALRAGKIECRIYNKDKFHAKAYITHAKMEVIGAQALVGSSNFTFPGLTQNVELNIQVQSGREVAQLQQWFDIHWEDGKDITDDIIKLISRHTQLFTPFDVYTKALDEFFRGHEVTASEWEDAHSKMFSCLDRYQKEAYWALMKIARQHGGAFLCDGVGLGKTFVGLMLIERLILHQGKRVVLFAPKGAREGVWEPHLKEWLPHIGGGADFSNLAVFSHTDLNRKGDFPERFRRIAELADVVIIDEAHHFRNPGSLGDPDTREGRSRYHKLNDLLGDSVRRKTIFMLTATPINNRISDLRHMIELFSRRNEAYFARTLGVHSLRAHFNNMEKALRRLLGHDPVDVAENIAEANEILSRDETFQNLVVQRSRAYAKASQLQENKSAAIFPDRKPPKVAEYSIRKTYGNLLDRIEAAFAKRNPLFSLAIYYPLYYAKTLDESVEYRIEENRQRQVVGLIRTMFLKRFESSVWAFELSCDRLMKKLLAFIEKNSETEAEKKRLERWKHQNADILAYASQQQMALWVDEETEDSDEDIISPELLEAAEKLPRDEYRVGEIIFETFLDLDEIVHFLQETKKFETKHDDKLKKLIRLLKTKDLRDKKIIIFTEFADTARYISKQLVDAGIDGVYEVDGGSKGNRAEIIERFSPYYNGTSSGQLAKEGKTEIRVLISTDVLAEGLNLQDACRMINYDIHWNPVRLMQRIGRVDRRLNPEVEKRLVADHPDVAESRGKISFWNFLPPVELNRILSLYTTVTKKTLLISKTLGIERRQLLTPDDQYDELREFNQAYEGKKTIVEEMHLEHQKLLQEDPELAAHLNGLPGAIFSGRK
ncbi:MAG: helicase-related protein, partial [Planctomycetota bacterium]